VREEWQGVAEKWAHINTPSAKVVAMGKHLMFWERFAAFNEELSRFLDEVH
jgi:hypothetical protein